MTHDLASLSKIIDAAFEDRAAIDTTTTGEVRDAVEETLNLLDRGKLRVAEKKDGDWAVNQWAKKAVLLSFRLNPMDIIKGGPGDATWVAAWYSYKLSFAPPFNIGAGAASGTISVGVAGRRPDIVKAGVAGRSTKSPASRVTVSSPSTARRHRPSITTQKPGRPKAS